MVEATNRQKEQDRDIDKKAIEETKTKIEDGSNRNREGGTIKKKLSP